MKNHQLNRRRRLAATHGAAAAMAHQIQTQDVAHLVDQLLAVRTWYGITAVEATCLWLRHHLAAGQLTYRADGRRDTWSRPLVTLLRGGGDCEDLSLLVVSLLHAAEARQAAIVIGRMFNGREWVGHAWVEGVDERGGFLLEATNGTITRGIRPATHRPAMFVTPRGWLSVETR